MTKLVIEKNLSSLTERNSGELFLAGVLDYRTGKKLHTIGNTLISNSVAKEFTLDCAGVTRTSSVGLSLVLSLVRDAERIGKQLVIKNLPVDMQEIARFSGVIELLPLAADFKVIAENKAVG